MKYVRGWGQAIPRTVVEADYKLISPAFIGEQVDARALAWCRRRSETILVLVPGPSAALDRLADAWLPPLNGPRDPGTQA